MNAFNGERAPGTVIDGKYRIDQLIGQGGMGAVYRAVQIAIDRPVAVKLLHAPLAHHAQMVARFHQEARVAASIGHDNICEVTDLGHDESGTPYLVMPLLKGSSMAELLAEQDGVLPLERISDLLSQVLSALSAAHRADIVHRDLKPANIFITTLGDREDFVKLLDFGISKVMAGDLGGALTHTGAVMGTAYYMAPEQALGDRAMDHRVDIYAVGAILYEALVGRRPFEGTSFNHIVSRIITEPFPRPRHVRPDLSGSIESVILKAMDKDPAARFTSAREMMRALEEATFAPCPENAEPQETLATHAGDADETTAFPRPSSRRPRAFQGKDRGKKRLLAVLAVGIILPLLALVWWTSGAPSRVAPRRATTVQVPSSPPSREAPAAHPPPAPASVSPPSGAAEGSPPEEPPSLHRGTGAKKKRPANAQMGATASPRQQPAEITKATDTDERERREERKEKLLRIREYE